MRTFLILMMFAVGCWFLYDWVRKSSTPEKIQQGPMVRYTTALHNDIQQAKAARAQADAAVHQAEQSTPE